MRQWSRRNGRGLLLTQGNKILGSLIAGKLEIGRILHLKFETRNLRLDRPNSEGYRVHFEISSFEFEMQDSSNFKQGSPASLL